jgi:16S rRNA (guanine966-N2)-methyltransferase
MLRIIAGDLGGRRLRAPPGLRTRPTSSRVREALFNILGPRLGGATVLDLYAGSGALGIEALSRGAARAIFVEQDAGVCRTLLHNLREVAMSDRTQVLQRPVRAALPQLLAHGRFDVVFADPPYRSDELPWLLTQLAQSAALHAGGRLVLERATRDAEALDEKISTAAEVGAPGGLILCDRRRYGDTSLLFYCLVGDAT